jgi:hypothetical protein
MRINNSNNGVLIGAGEIVSITGGGGAAEQRAVIHSATDATGQNELVFDKPLQNSHNGTPTATVTTLGSLGVTKTVTIQGDVGAPAPVTSSLEVSTGTIGVVFQNINYTAADPLTLDGGSARTTVRNSMLSCIQELRGTGDRGNVFSGNIIASFATINGDAAGPTADQVLNNRFTGSAGLFMINNSSAVVQGNTFQLRGTGFVAIEIVNSENVQIRNNTVHISGGNANSAGIILLENSAVFPGTKLSAVVANNVLDTGGVGSGVRLIGSILGSATDSVSATIQGNDLHGNAFGVEVQAVVAGTVDLGSRTAASVGGNNFRSFTAAAAAAGKFAVYVHDTGVATTVSAKDNIWDVADPNTVVKDGTHNTTVGTTPTLPNGSGLVDVGTPQLTADQKYLQTLYNDFLGRSGSLDELNAWVAVLAARGRGFVANSIARSHEALGHIVDQLYLNYLQRTATTDPGREAWIQFLQRGGTVEQVSAGFLTSEEYYNHVKDTLGSPDASYIQSLYNKVLGRNASVDEVNAWVGHLPALGRFNVAMGFVQSLAHRRDVVAGLYTDLLRRPGRPGDGELDGWAATGLDTLSLEAILTTSDECYTRG